MKIGLVAGNFDVIHPGYVKLFEDAKSKACNYLVVALQGDPTIERPQKCKPVQSIKERDKQKEDRKDERTRIQASQQSELIDQRKGDKPPKNFESAGNDILGGDKSSQRPVKGNVGHCKVLSKAFFRGLTTQ